MALPVTIPNTFANATSSIPLSQLDTNFSTLANAVNGLNSGSETLANLKATTANVGVLTVTGNATIGDASTDTVTLNSTLTANTAVIFAAGTSAAPSITTTGDTNTGIFFPAADTVAIGTGGTEALRVTSAQNVRKIYGTEIQSLTSGGSTSHMLSYQTWNGTANLLVLGNTFDGVVFATGGGTMAEKMRLDASGNLCIGTTSATTSVGTSKTLTGAKTHLAWSFGSNSNSTTFANQSTVLFVDMANAANNNEYASSGILINNYSGAASNPGVPIRIYNERFPNNPARCFEINYVGNIGLGDTDATTSGTGITFPATQSASSNANTLDDYEEGTYVVTFTPDTSGSITLNSSNNELSYIKVGSQVTIFGRVLISSVSSPVGDIRISMPFTPETGLVDQSDFYAMPMFTHDVNLSAGALSVFGESSGSNFWTIYQTLDNAAWTPLPAANLKGNGNEYFYITGSYRAA